MAEPEGLELVHRLNAEPDTFALVCAVCRDRQVSTEPLAVWWGHVELPEVLRHAAGHEHVPLADE